MVLKQRSMLDINLSSHHSDPRLAFRRCTPTPQELQVLERGQVIYIQIYTQALCAAPLHHGSILSSLTIDLWQQWNAFVEVLPLWLAPNMVTLLGFMFIVGNVMLIEVYMPDLIGPVRLFVRILSFLVLRRFLEGTFLVILQFRFWHVDVRWLRNLGLAPESNADIGIRRWTTSMANRHGEPEHLVGWGSYLS